MQLIRIQEIDIFEINLFIINGGRVCVHAVKQTSHANPHFLKAKVFLVIAIPLPLTINNYMYFLFIQYLFYCWL